MIFCFAECEPGQWKCEYGKCIDETKKCDQTLDCLDKSDESEITCRKYYHIFVHIWSFPLHKFYSKNIQSASCGVYASIMEIFGKKPGRLNKLIQLRNNVFVAKLDSATCYISIWSIQEELWWGTWHLIEQYTSVQFTTIRSSSILYRIH